MTNSKTLPQIKEINWLIAGSALLLAISLYLVNYTNIDLELQKFLFDFETKTWIVDRDEPVKKFIFYNLPKILFGLAVTCFVVAYYLSIKSSSKDFFRKNRHRFALILLGFIAIPLLAGNIKKFTNVYCPNQHEIYGGKYPYVKILEAYPRDFVQEDKGQCFPAGHCVTGFVLMILFFALKDKKQRLIGLFSGIIFGWILGFYQMSRGVHFFSDTLISMLICFLLAAIIYRLYYRFLESKYDK